MLCQCVPVTLISKASFGAESAASAVRPESVLHALLIRAVTYKEFRAEITFLFFTNQQERFRAGNSCREISQDLLKCPTNRTSIFLYFMDFRMGFTSGLLS